MRFSPLLLVALVFANGCATNHPDVSASQITQKRQELAVLCSEIDILTHRLQVLQDRVITNSSYSASVQVHLLDRSILAAHQARDILIINDHRLCDALAVYEGH
jgi:hypothetical protein